MKYSSFDERKSQSKNPWVLKDLAKGKVGLKRRTADEKSRNAPVMSYTNPTTPLKSAQRKKKKK